MKKKIILFTTALFLIISCKKDEPVVNDNSPVTPGNTFPGALVTVAGGTFSMGSPDGIGLANERPQHNVTLSSFSISKYEITNAQYAAFLNDIRAEVNGSFNGEVYINMGSNLEMNHIAGSFVVDSGKENHPVVYVTWQGAKAYAEHYGGRLPTEAEWEFAAKGGSLSSGYIYSGSNNSNDVAWYNSNSAGVSHPVGLKSPNELGIFDMSGNVNEWNSDWYGGSSYYSISPTNNPQGPATGVDRVMRGGSWYHSASQCRVAFRMPWFNILSGSYLDIGFRPVFDS